MNKEEEEEEVNINEFLDVAIEKSTENHQNELIKELAIEAVPEKIETETLKKQIADIFINKQLESALLEYGSIPQGSAETIVGVGFLDIVDYSYISSWLSPRENQIFLNGLYSAFYYVLKKRGGFLNKISGDSMMFHFGGIIDPLTRNLKQEEAEPLIARLLFQTCIELQESCRLFNRADEDFIPQNAEPGIRKAITQAFLIMKNLRENLSLITTIDAMFQVRIRIGASLGEVCIGNFGPEGARQFDIIGNPVIEARRMESTAPVDCIRITSHLMDVLKTTNLMEQYLYYFRSKASGFYQLIEMKELFLRKDVTVHEKRNARFESYAVQANPDLPEDIWRYIEAHIEMGEQGIETIIDTIKYYRGNRLVIEAVEELFRERDIQLRKADIFKLLAPQHYKKILDDHSGNKQSAETYINENISLYKLFSLLSSYQDHWKKADLPEQSICSFDTYDDWITKQMNTIETFHQEMRKINERKLYFEEILMPAIFLHIEGSLREHIKHINAVFKSSDCA
ncbi:MAG TPA: adenylate/guanylate cyclase domain-containing protein [Spirochaetia bacterium]|nr:adenylate/guanylate cyclase domain-containing protein [Spirochaetales bacterium]HQK35602.1 adenylate/guanylate cyclase domain-containing protein [Spirochaetales bacterium]HRS66372.1 adenylate/guanylate cyclase domain-containing protein [Spirochaetia bacterium]HRV29231.1 adenylate/guanylate cyclase domain-containing protein [Spirochaetia bacterium]